MQVAAAQAHADRADAVRPEDRLAVERHLRAEAQARVDELKRQRNQQVPMTQAEQCGECIKCSTVTGLGLICRAWQAISHTQVLGRFHNCRVPCDCFD